MTRSARQLRARFARLAGTALIFLWAPGAVGQEMPRTPGEFYRAGERFAHCSAHFAFTARIAREQGLPDNAVAFEGMERGWRLAGLMLLTEGLDPVRQPQVQDLFANLQSAKLDQIKAWRELEPQTYSKTMLDDFQANCAPWTDLQKSIIAAMRGAAAPTN